MARFFDFKNMLVARTAHIFDFWNKLTAGTAKERFDRAKFVSDFAGMLTRITFILVVLFFIRDSAESAPSTHIWLMLKGVQFLLSLVLVLLFWSVAAVLSSVVMPDTALTGKGGQIGRRYIFVLIVNLVVAGYAIAVFSYYVDPTFFNRVAQRSELWDQRIGTAATVTWEWLRSWL